MTKADLAVLEARILSHTASLRRAAAEAEYFAARNRPARRSAPRSDAPSQRKTQSGQMSEVDRKILNGEFMRMSCDFRLDRVTGRPG